jgi:hypothetical protein
MLELDSIAEFRAARDAECFAAVPARPAVFLVEAREELAGAKPYLLRTANLRERLKRLLGLPEPASKRLNLREFAARVRDIPWATSAAHAASEENSAQTESPRRGS